MTAKMQLREIEKDHYMMVLPSETTNRGIGIDCDGLGSEHVVLCEEKQTLQIEHDEKQIFWRWMVQNTIKYFEIMNTQEKGKV